MLLKIGEMRRMRNSARATKVIIQRPDNQTLPSPREHNKTNNLIVPTVNLLPYYFVGECIVYQQALKEFNRMMKYNLFKKDENKLLQVIDTHKFLDQQNANKPNNGQINGLSSLKSPEQNPQVGEFTRPELLHLNAKPKMEYLRKEKVSSKYQQQRRNFTSTPDQDGVGVSRRPAKSVKKEFNDTYFKTMVQAAKTRIGNNSNKKIFTFLSHLSELRIEPLSHFKAEDVVETLKRSIFVLQFKYKEYEGIE